MHYLLTRHFKTIFTIGIYPLVRSVHGAPCRQGLGPHSSISFWQSNPSQPGAQWHVNVASPSSHVAPFWHVERRQSFGFTSHKRPVKPGEEKPDHRVSFSQWELDFKGLFPGGSHAAASGKSSNDDPEKWRIKDSVGQFLHHSWHWNLRGTCTTPDTGTCGVPAPLLTVALSWRQDKKWDRDSMEVVTCWDEPIEIYYYRADLVLLHLDWGCLLDSRIAAMLQLPHFEFRFLLIG